MHRDSKDEKDVDWRGRGGKVRKEEFSEVLNQPYEEGGGENEEDQRENEEDQRENEEDQREYEEEDEEEESEEEGEKGKEKGEEKYDESYSIISNLY